MFQIFYHGTAAEGEFTVFNGDLIYLAPTKEEASVFAENPILAKGKQGKQRVLIVQTKVGRIKDINQVVTKAIFNDDDIDAVILIEAGEARTQGYRYLEFEHPGVKEEFNTRISLYPAEDLLILTSC